MATVVMVFIPQPQELEADRHNYGQKTAMRRPAKRHAKKGNRNKKCPWGYGAKKNAFKGSSAT